jgi:hypothetical protein
MQKKRAGIAVGILAGMFLAHSALAEPHQPEKIPKIGFVAGSGDPSILGLRSRRSGKDCGISQACPRFSESERQTAGAA